MWTHTVKNHVVQRLAVFTFVFLNNIYVLLSLDSSILDVTY